MHPSEGLFTPAMNSPNWADETHTNRKKTLSGHFTWLPQGFQRGVTFLDLEHVQAFPQNSARPGFNSGAVSFSAKKKCIYSFCLKQWHDFAHLWRWGDPPPPSPNSIVACISNIVSIWNSGLHYLRPSKKQTQALRMLTNWSTWHPTWLTCARRMRRVHCCV